MYNLLMESEERRRERLRRRNQRDRDRRAAQQKQAREKGIEPIVLHILLPSGSDFWVTGEGD